MSDSNHSWQRYNKVILLQRADNSDTHQVLLKSLVLAGVNAAVLPSHLSSALHSYVAWVSYDESPSAAISYFICNIAKNP